MITAFFDLQMRYVGDEQLVEGLNGDMWVQTTSPGEAASLSADMHAISLKGGEVSTQCRCVGADHIF